MHRDKVVHDKRILPHRHEQEPHLEFCTRALRGAAVALFRARFFFGMSHANFAGDMGGGIQHWLDGELSFALHDASSNDDRNS